MYVCQVITCSAKMKVVKILDPLLTNIPVSSGCVLMPLSISQLTRFARASSRVSSFNSRNK